MLGVEISPAEYQQAWETAIALLGDSTITGLTWSTIKDKLDAVQLSTPSQMLVAEILSRFLDLKGSTLIYDYTNADALKVREQETRDINNDLTDTAYWTQTHLETGGTASSATPTNPTVRGYLLTTHAVTDDLVRIRCLNSSTTLHAYIYTFVFTTSDIATARVLSGFIADEDLTQHMSHFAETVDNNVVSWNTEQAAVDDTHLNFPRLIVPAGWYMDFVLADTLGVSETIQMAMSELRSAGGP